MQNLIESKKQTLNQTLGFKYTSKNIENLLRGLSQSRLNRYAELASTRQSQLHLYSWNSALSQALYVPLQGLEIITRNYFNGMLVNSFGIQWYENKKIEFEYMQEKYLVDAKATLINEKNSNVR